jgi:preprotein translocase subunit Sec61beta
MRDNRVSMPSSGAGITRYFEEFKSKYQLKPITVVIILVIIALIVLVLHRFGYDWMGLSGLV